MFMVNHLSGFGGYNAGVSLPATSYANSGGTGDRTGIITVTTDVSIDEGVILSIVNGNLTYNSTGGCSPTGAAVAGKYIRFDFGTPVYINEARLSSTTSTNGNWKWQAGPDTSSFVDIGSTFAMIGADVPSFAVIGDMSSNAALYRYYQCLGVSGNDAGGIYLVEFEFKIGA